MIITRHKRSTYLTELNTSKDETVTVLDRACDERSEEREQEVPDPVRACREGGLVGTGTRGETLAGQNPDTRRPGHSVAQDKQTCGDDHHCRGRR